MPDSSRSEKPSKDIKDFDDILDYVGGWGPFQYFSTLVFFLFNIFLGYVYLSPIITLYTPPHFCKIPQLANLSLEARRQAAIPTDSDIIGGFSQCHRYNVDWDQVSGDISEESVAGVTSDNQTETVPCDQGWEYDMEGYHVSITVEMDWVCDKAWIPALSQSCFFLGAIPGMIFFGWFADAYGRMPAIVLSNILCLLCGMVTPFFPGSISFIILRFAMGLAFNTFFTVPYILVMEYVSIEKRTLVGNLGLAVALTLSGVYQPWLAKYLGHWKAFNWAIFAQMVTIFIVPFILPESCRWLMAKGRKEKTLTILKRIAKTNKKTVDESVWRKVEELCDKQTDESNKYTYLDLFRTPEMRRISILVILLWAVISCIFDTTVRNISNLNFEFYLSFMIAASMELPADLCSIWGINWLGRRWSASLSLIMCGLTILPCAFITELKTAQIILFLVGRFFSTYAMNVGFQFTVEVMPTCLRGQGNALVNVMSMVSQMASPYIVYSSVISEKAPFLIISFLCLLGAIPGLFLPETADLKMPETLEDIKEFGRHDRVFWMPLCRSRRRFRKSLQKEFNNITMSPSSVENKGFAL